MAPSPGPSPAKGSDPTHPVGPKRRRRGQEPRPGPITELGLTEFRPGSVVPGTAYFVRNGAGVEGPVWRFEVEHVDLKKAFVLHALGDPSGASSEQEIHRFCEDWRVLGELEHPNLVRVTDAGVTPCGVQFWVTELPLGPTLAERLREPRPLELTEALGIALGVLRGLEAAHRAGVVHGGFRPQHVVLGGQIKVTGFGTWSPLCDPAPSVIQARARLEVDRYQPPELASGAAPTPAADAYAAGALLVEMLNLSPVRTRRRHSARTGKAGRVPDAVQAVTAGLLAPQPSGRLPVAEAADAVAVILQAQAGPRQRRPTTSCPTVVAAPSSVVKTVELALAPTMVAAFEAETSSAGPQASMAPSERCPTTQILEAGSDAVVTRTCNVEAPEPVPPSADRTGTRRVRRHRLRLVHVWWAAGAWAGLVVLTATVRWLTEDVGAPQQSAVPPSPPEPTVIPRGKLVTGPNDDPRSPDADTTRTDLSQGTEVAAEPERAGVGEAGDPAAEQQSVRVSTAGDRTAAVPSTSERAQAGFPGPGASVSTPDVRPTAPKTCESSCSSVCCVPRVARRFTRRLGEEDGAPPPSR